MAVLWRDPACLPATRHPLTVHLLRRLRFLKAAFGYRLVQLGERKPETQRKCMFLVGAAGWLWGAGCCERWVGE